MSVIMKKREKFKHFRPQSRDRTIDFAFRGTRQKKIKPKLRKKSFSPLGIRKKKIRAIRKEISTGKYETDEKLS